MRNGTLYLLRLGGPCISSFCVESALYPAYVTSGWGLYSTLQLFRGGVCILPCMCYFWVGTACTLPCSSFLCVCVGGGGVCTLPCICYFWVGTACTLPCSSFLFFCVGGGGGVCTLPCSYFGMGSVFYPAFVISGWGQPVLYPAILFCSFVCVCVGGGGGLYSTLHLLFLGGDSLYSTLQFFFVLLCVGVGWRGGGGGSVLYPAVGVSGWGLYSTLYMRLLCGISTVPCSCYFSVGSVLQYSSYFWVGPLLFLLLNEVCTVPCTCYFWVGTVLYPVIFTAKWAL